jgi:hypothetical protein
MQSCTHTDLETQSKRHSHWHPKKKKGVDDALVACSFPGQMFGLYGQAEIDGRPLWPVHL